MVEVKAKYHVLLVDDDARSLLLLDDLLEQDGRLTIFKAENGFASMELMRREKIDIMVTDFMMPEMDGITLMKECLAIKPELVVVMQSAANELEIAVEALRSGAFDFIPKPIDSKRLRLTIDKCIEKLLLLRRLGEQGDKLRLLMTTIEQSPVSILITDQHGTIQYVNPNFCDVTGYGVEEVIGKNPRVLKSGVTPPESYRDLWSTILSGQIWKGEIQNRKKNGELFWERVTISPVYNVQGEIKNRMAASQALDKRVAATPGADSTGRITHFIAIKEDITHEKALVIKQAEQEQIRQQEQIRAMNQGKLASLGEIATGIAHEINQPLTFINTLLHTTIERLAKGAIDVEKLTTKFERGIHQAARITTIIDHLRTFGRADEKKLTPVDMEHVLDNALILMQERIRLRNITIRRKIEKNLPAIIGNSHSLEQIFINFFQNSIDAMEGQGGGQIMIAMGHEPGGSEIWISFADSGPGMTPEVKEKMFEPFFTTKEIGKGTGLGLAVVFGIIRDHQGEIVCHSEPDKGTTFYITLPLHPAAQNDVV